MNELFLIKEKLCLFPVLMKTKFWGNLIAYRIDFRIVYLINVLVFKVITLNTCCPLEPNVLSAYAECQLSGIRTVVSHT